MSDAVIIFLIFFGTLFAPVIIVFSVLGIAKHRRKKKKLRCRGVAAGTITKISRRSTGSPSVIHVSYFVKNIEYKIKETAKLKSEAIRVGNFPIGQRKTFCIGPATTGDTITVCYDPSNPQIAIIDGNDGHITG